MSEALEIAELEGQNSSVDIVDVLDYLAFATAQVKQFHSFKQLNSRFFILIYFDLIEFIEARQYLSCTRINQENFGLK